MSGKKNHQKTLCLLSFCCHFFLLLVCVPASLTFFFHASNYIWCTRVLFARALFHSLCFSVLLLSVFVSAALIFTCSLLPSHSMCYPIEMLHVRFSTLRSQPIWYLLLKCIRCAINLMLMSNCNFKPLSDINYLTFFARTKPMAMVLYALLLARC